MNPSIKKFVINGLFGRKNIELDFKDNVQIYVGENGLGKTTILNALYYVLSCDFKKLAKINFESIEVYFKDDNVEFSKDEMQKYLIAFERRGRSSLIQHLRDSISDEDVSRLRKIREENITDAQKNDKIRAALKKIPQFRNIPVPFSRIVEIVDQVIDGMPLSRFASVRAKIKDNVDSKILYFPTYRRIEEELKNLGISDSAGGGLHSLYHDESGFFSSPDEDDEGEDAEPDGNSLIQFGMADVEKRIKTITQEISRSSVSGFSKLTGDMLVQLLRGYPDVSGIEKINIEDITIILNRVGNNLDQDDKNKVIELIRSNKIFETENKQLIYFLQKLLELYKSQVLYDAAIKDFMYVCNGYLNDKHYEYNESTVDLRIFRNDETNKKEEVSLSQLSSGEKQIVSLFSKIYLEPEDNFIVLFDEPELSLSIFWQKKLLPDIVKSNRCDFLLAVTHSPFIFENELKKNTIGLKEFIKK